MEKDKRYLTVKRLVEGGYIQFFSEIFDNIPPSVVARDLGFNYNRLGKLISKVEGWALKDIYELSVMFGIDEMTMITLMHNQHLQDKKNRRKK
jgi:5,10-methylene-tetrahydrofolate dehydrogenase/methenyl tetrahydrofolate cyclohydrolase